MMLRRNVLIFHLGALGDFVLTWPLALAMGRMLPQSRIIYVTHRQKGMLAEKVLRLDSTDVEQGWHHLFGDAAALPERAVKLLAGAQAVLSFISTNDDIWTQRVRRLAPEAKVLTLRGKPAGDFAGHASDHLLNELQPWPPARQATQQMLRSIEQRGVCPRQPGGGGVVLHPGSGSPQKSWPLENFIELARRLRGAGHEVRVLLGEVEAERFKSADLAGFADVARLVRPADYVELWQQISSAGVLVANDSGPGHLGAIVGVPTVSLFGPTSPTVWRPLGPSVHVLQADPIATLEVARVYDQVESLIGG